MSKCILCNTVEEQKHLFTKDGNKIFKCKKCGFVYVYPIYLINHIYNTPSYTGYQGSDIILNIEATWRLSIISKYKKRGKLLDIGCGTGFYLQKCKEAGWEVYGTEISKWAIKFAEKKFNIKINEGYLKEIQFPDKFFDVVTMFHVIEHIKNPMDELKEINRILKDDGILCIETPNVMSIDSIINKKNWRCLGPEHFYFFSKYTLILAGKIAGFESIFIKALSGWERLRSSYPLPKKIIHKILTSINMGNRLLCIFKKIPST